MNLAQLLNQRMPGNLLLLGGVAVAGFIRTVGRERRAAAEFFTSVASNP